MMLLTCWITQTALQIDYKAHQVQVMMEATGVNLTRAKLQPYFDAGMAKVVVSAPVKDAENPVLNIVVGCNEVCAARCYMLHRH
jgi:glyceraldehyde-3-phosphate dehydrogenase/erythrose-4-phosphate dehydrogenase